MVIGVLTAPMASANDKDLKDKQRRVKNDISSASRHLDESSAALRKATSRLSAARTALRSARADLAETRGQVTTARVRDVQAQADLTQAEADLATARTELKTGRVAVQRKGDDVGDMVADIYEQGDPRLASFSSVLAAQDPTDITRSLSAQDSMVTGETARLDELEAAEILLGVQRDNVVKKKKIVAAKRVEAAENLSLMQSLEARAQEQTLSVRSLVGKRSSAQGTASRVKSRDRAELARLEREQSRIESMLRARAAAAAAAAARKSGPAARTSAPPANSGGYLSNPVSGSVTSSYGYRVHPIYGYYSLHDGTDFGAGCGQPLYATADGTVISRYFQTAWGNRLIVDHGYQRGVGLATIYNHATSYTVGVGARVKRGQVIGYVGNTGWSTGCHLHFSVMVNGSPKNPMGWL